MELRFSDDKFVLDCNYSEFKSNGSLIKTAGFRWNPQTKKWWTDDTTKALKLGEFAVGEAKSKLVEVQELLLGSRATNFEGDIPAPKGLEYFGYQKAGINFGMGRDGVLIADEMGLGKTIQALGILNTMTGVKNVLVISPASVKAVWKKESMKWLVEGCNVKVLMGSKKPVVIDNGKSINVIITNYDNIHKDLDGELKGMEFSVLICDECHKLKNPKAIRTCAVLGGECKSMGKDRVFDGIKADKRIFLTGTPIVNRPKEFIGILGSLAPDMFGKVGSFLYKYCGPEAVVTKGGRVRTTFNGASNTDELNQKLRTSCMVRRLKSEVLKELPSKVHSFIPVEVKGATKLFEEMADILGIDENSTAESIRASFDNLSSKKFQEISKIRRKVGVAKIIPAVEYIKDLVEAGEKVLVFAHHKDVLDGVQSAFDNTVRIDGSTPQKDREEIVERFQSDDSVRVFFGSIRACGEGLTLTKATQVVFVEEDWTTGAMAQAEDRAHRIGQDSIVTVHHITADGTLDELIREALVEKGTNIRNVLDVVTREEGIQIGSLAQTTKEEKKPASTVSEELREAVHQALKLLSGMCDGAYDTDGMGFNKFDTGFGKSLASARRLSDKQFGYGLKMVKKYRGQLPNDLVEIICKK